MPFLLGYGLPSSLTPQRIKKVLGFARSQEREFEAALDHNAAYVWTQYEAGSDFYQSIHRLLRTSDGREAYTKAKHIFERDKPKRFGRADFFGRLTTDCLQAVLDQESFASVGSIGRNDVGNAQLCTELLARAMAWKYLAEFVWALSAGSKLGDTIVDVIQEHPEVAPFLEEVQAGLVPINDPTEQPRENPLPEQDGEVAVLVENVGEIVTSLDARHLDSTILGDLSDAVERLITIANSRESRHHVTKCLQSRLSRWQETYSDALAATPELEARVSALEIRVAVPRRQSGLARRDPRSL